MHLFTIAISGVHPFDEEGPAFALYAMLKGMLEVCRLNSDEIAIELLIGMNDPKYLNLDSHPLLNIPMIAVLRSYLKSLNGLETTISCCAQGTFIWKE